MTKLLKLKFKISLETLSAQHANIYTTNSLCRHICCMRENAYRCIFSNLLARERSFSDRSWHSKVISSYSYCFYRHTAFVYIGQIQSKAFDFTKYTMRCYLANSYRVEPHIYGLCRGRIF